MKLTKTMLAIIGCIAFSLSFSANEIVESEIYYPEEDITVVFNENSALSSEQKQFISYKIVSGEPIGNDGVSTYSLCWLTGHDIINEMVTVIEHKVRVSNPRCDKNSYNVESCNKCDYMEYELISEVYYPCCPEE